jgi:hypothetical protein
MIATSKDVTNFDDLIYSLDVIARIEELAELVEPKPMPGDGNYDAETDLFKSEREELTALKALEAEAEPYAPDWRYGAQLVRYSYFKEHAQDLAEDCDMIPRDATWPNNCIDWDKAARQLQQDYTEIDFGGVAYWVR